MAGGAGTRLWPLSRGDTPKQLLKVVRGKSLLQLAFERLKPLVPVERIFICSAASAREAILEALPELPPDNLLGEPIGRDTANAVGFPAAVLKTRDKDAVMAIVTADHVIEPQAEFEKAMRLAFNVVKSDGKAMVTFGITPTHGHTGLGYIHRGDTLGGEGNRGAYYVQAFKEKPDKPTADRYAESGRYYWNSGMFVWRADLVLEELGRHLPASHSGLTQIGAAWDTPQRQQIVNTVYPTLPKISIDYAIMEPVSQGKSGAHLVVVEMPVQWLDVGSWPALAETLDNDEHDNAIDAATCLIVDSDNNIVVSSVPEHLVTIMGVSDMIIVHTKDITMVCPKSEAQRVKELVNKAKGKYGSKYQ